jgi:hypothetical protein
MNKELYSIFTIVDYYSKVLHDKKLFYYADI